MSRFGSADYAFEELVAELGSAMCCATTGIENTVREDHSKYIKNWLKALKDDKKFIFTASSHAQKAVDYLYSFQEQQQEVA
jgi:antirestriction protein ArdC